MLVAFLAFALPVVGHAQLGRCPFNMQAQYQLQLQWRPTGYMQQQMMMRQYQTTMLLRQQQPMLPRSPYLQPRLTTYQRSTTTLTPRNTFAMTRTTALQPINLRTYTGQPVRLNSSPLKLDGSPLRLNSSPLRIDSTPTRIGGPTKIVSRTTLEQRRSTFVTTTRKAGVERKVVGDPRKGGEGRKNTYITQRKTNTVERKTGVPRVQHTPQVDLRVKLSVTCGNCHGCKQDQTMPPVARQPLNVLPIDRPRPIDRPLVRLDRPRQPVVNRPGPERPPVVWQPRARPLPVVRNPLLPPPVLPPLVVVHDAPPLLPVIQPPGDRPARPRVKEVGKARETKAPDKPPVLLHGKAPPLPSLDAAVTQATLQPALQRERRGREGGSDPTLLPEQVAQVPAPGPLPELPLMRGLLPASREEIAPPEKPSALALVLSPPILPPLTDR
jgi:hypothetical protein